jgi:hypothetical protein
MTVRRNLYDDGLRIELGERVASEEPVRTDQQGRVTIVVADMSYSRKPILITGAAQQPGHRDLFEMFDFDRTRIAIRTIAIERRGAGPSLMTQQCAVIRIGDRSAPAPVPAVPSPTWRMRGSAKPVVGSH